MPLYEYECEACHHRFEKIQKFSDPLVEICPNCSKPSVKKLLSSPAIQFKGTGWYITDYAKKSGTDAGKSSSSSQNETKSDSGSSSSSSSSTSSSSSSTPSSTTSSDSSDKKS